MRGSRRLALVAAVEPCTPATWVKCAGPVTCPAAETRGLLVRSRVSTMTNPCLSRSTPVVEVAVRSPTLWSPDRTRNRLACGIRAGFAARR